MKSKIRDLLNKTLNQIREDMLNDEPDHIKKLLLNHVPIRFIQEYVERN